MQTFIDEALGFALAIPPGWQLLPAAWVGQFRRRAATSRELADILGKASKPFLCLHLPQDDAQAAIPTVQCSARPTALVEALGGLSGVLELTLRQLAAAFADLAVLERRDALLVAGVRGAYLKVAMSLCGTGRPRCACIAELYVLPARRQVFLLGLSGPADPARRPVDDFAAILRSLRLS